ncbi:unnamed protein product [Adineta steineri]|uniref:Uncharacterized protein n=1 Tax=Adineta steineri TaxID=433720 RepID=A0A815BH71_9BILA|nr:unnamed protein product [Adineta steineri]CAF1399479.1 unnamed protein product [Adineta steineri]CAF1412738.1 unnamed protein product [Adineta steineri]CAF1412792.1 unnamed protein product [Adineta steineri]CAF1450838.1 unnamed protein product [Adineta steineri]
MGARYKQEILSEGNIHTIFLEIAQLTAKDSDAYKVTTNIQLNIEAIDFKLPEGITPSFLNKPSINPSWLSWGPRGPISHIFVQKYIKVFCV